MTLTLQQYAEKHNLTIVEEYTTLGGDWSSNHQRAIATDNKTGEKYYLYFDRSRKRRSLSRQKKDLELMHQGIPVPYPPSRGWRNTTLDNRRKNAAINRRHEEANVRIDRTGTIK